MSKRKTGLQVFSSRTVFYPKTTSFYLSYRRITTKAGVTLSSRRPTTKAEVTSRPPTTKAEVTLPSGHVVRVRIGDITDEETNAVVNAANERLIHGGGLAAAILRKGGHKIVAESERWIAKHGFVRVGDVAVTSGGKLPHAKYIIHAVGPTWQAKNGILCEEKLLYSAIERSLNTANSMKLQSIAIPAVSSGIFGFPKDLCAKVVFDVTEEYCKSHDLANRLNTLKVIHLTNFDETTVQFFERELKRRFLTKTST